MTRLSTKVCSALAASALLASIAASSASAQCATCVTPTVAYSPVVVQPAATGWYPGRLFDQWRMRRAAANAAVPTYTAAYAPYTAAYTPYAASYAPYTAAYAPSAYSVSYAPTATYAASYAPAASSCSSCAQTSYTPVVASYAPTTLYRPAVLQAVATEPACGGCAVASPCSACSAAAPAVEQVVYTEADPGCSSCAGSASTPAYSYEQAPSAQGSVIRQPQASANNPPAPSLQPEEAIPDSGTSPYGANRPEGQSTEDRPVPGPVEEDESDPNAAFEAPHLLNPHTDLRANRPTVDVHHAVYRQASGAKQVSTAARPAAQKTQAEIDAAGWYSVPRSR